MRRRGLGTAAALAALVLGSVGGASLGSGAQAGASDTAEELLTRARKISTIEPFAGVVEVRWTDRKSVV